MSDSQQLPLFDLPTDDDSAGAAKPARARQPRPSRAESDAEMMPLFSDALPPLPEPVPTIAPPPPPSLPTPEPEPSAPPLKLKYPSQLMLVPVILNAESSAVLDWLAPRVIDAGDAPYAAAELFDTLHDASGIGYTADQRANAAVMLGLLHQPVDVEALVAGIWGDEGQVAQALTEALGEIGTWVESSFDDLERIVHGLIVALRHPDAATRIAAAQAIGKMRAVVAVPEMIARVDIEPAPEVIEAIALVLGDLGTPETLEGILNGYEANRIPYELACRALILAGPAAVDILRGVVDQQTAAHTLASDVLAQLGAH